MATTLPAHLLRIGPALAIVYGGLVMLFASDPWPWLALPVLVLAFFYVRRRAPKGLPPVLADVWRLISGPSWLNWAALILFILFFAWLLIWGPGQT